MWKKMGDDENLPIKMNITKDKKQMSVRIPLAMEEKFQIDAKKDEIAWKAEETPEGFTLIGRLLKGTRKDEKQN